MFSSGQNDGRLNDFMQNQFPAGMLDMGIIAGQKVIMEKRDILMPGVSKFWSSLKMYFAVSNSYVLKKIFIVLYPIKNQSWGRVLADEGEETDAEV
jgi:YIF1